MKKLFFIILSVLTAAPVRAIEFRNQSDRDVKLVWTPMVLSYGRCKEGYIQLVSIAKGQTVESQAPQSACDATSFNWGNCSAYPVGAGPYTLTGGIEKGLLTQYLNGRQC